MEKATLELSRRRNCEPVKEYICAQCQNARASSGGMM